MKKTKYIYALSVKGLSVCALFAVQVFIARIISVYEYGIYSYVVSLITVFTFIVICGADKLIIKKVSINYEYNKHEDIRSHIFNYYFIILINTLLSLPFVYLFIKSSAYDSNSINIYLISFVFLFLSTASRMSASVTKGLNLVVSSEAVLNLIRPLSLLIGLFLFWKYAVKVTLVETLLFTSGSYGLSFLLTYIVNAPKLKGSSFRPDLQPFEHYKELLPFFLIGIGVPLLSNIGILVMGVLADSRDVALYSASSKIINLVLMGLVSANLLIAPKLSVLYAEKRTEEMSGLVRNNNIFVLLVTLFPVLVILLQGPAVLSLFGEQYVSANLSLQVLLIGQIINVICGPVNIMCIMTGQQWRASIIVVSACMLEALLCFLLIPQQGLLGAALAHIVALGVMNIAQVCVVYTQIGINPTVFNVLRTGRG